jgi:DNA-binding response OmpR family regulator
MSIFFAPRFFEPTALRLGFSRQQQDRARIFTIRRHLGEASRSSHELCGHHGMNLDVRTTMWQRPIVIAVFDTNSDVVELLRVSLEQAGFVVVSGHIDDLRRGTLDLPNFIRQHDPGVIVYDIPPPYDAHWRFLEHVRHSPDMQGRAFVLTSTNVQRIEEVIGTREPIHELIGKPYDLEQITRAVREAGQAGSAAPLQRYESQPSSTHEARDQRSNGILQKRSRTATPHSVRQKRRSKIR